MNNEMCVEKMPITEEYLEKMNAYWRAANYLSFYLLYILKGGIFICMIS
jgi:xylulose-5-phosphate/fructose-6-phosphate phosphoketolase